MRSREKPQQEGRGRGRPRITPGVIREWVLRHRGGDKFTQIARAYGVERRTVSNAVKRYMEGEQADEAIGAWRTVAAEFLREHLRDLELGGLTLLRCTAPPLVSGQQEGKRNPDLVEKAVVADLERRSLRGYVAESPPDPVDRRRIQRWAKGVWAGLVEHLPGLEQLLYKLGATVTEEEWEGVYAELEDLLMPPRVRRQLVVGHCSHCPVPGLRREEGGETNA